MGELPKNFLVLLVTEERDAGVLVAPNRIHDGQGHQHAGGDHRVDVAEFATFDAAANYPTQHFLQSRYDFVGVELCEVGELVQLAKDEAIDGAEFGGAHELPVLAHRCAQLLGGRPSGCSLLACGNCRDGRLPDHLAEELFLIGEVEVDRALGDSGAIGDVLESGFGESAFAEDLESGLNDLLGSVLGSSTPFGRFCRWGGGARHSINIVTDQSVTY